MKDHPSADVLSALVDGECGPDERKWAHEHIASCEACRTVVAGFTSVRGLVGDLPRLVAPEDFVSSLVDRRTPVVRRLWRGPRRYLVGAAACIAVAVSLAGLAAPPERGQPPVDVFLTRHVGVNDASRLGGQVLFAVNGR